MKQHERLENGIQPDTETGFESDNEDQNDGEGVPDSVATVSEAALPEFDTDGRPIIYTDAQFKHILERAWHVLLTPNDPPTVFRQGESIVTVAVNAVTETPYLRRLRSENLFRHLVELASWKKVTGEGIANTKPPADIVRVMLAEPSRDLPELESIVTTPLLGKSWDLIAASGYNAANKVYMHDERALRLEDIPGEPSPSDVAAARVLLMDELLGDFPFADCGDRAHALCALLHPFLRLPLYRVCTPIYLITSPTPGSGKGLLTDVVSLISTGHSCVPTTVGANDDEVRKKLTALLAKAEPMIVIDNVAPERAFNSASLASAVTAPIWQDRMLNFSKTVTVATSVQWIVTGNSMLLGLDIARRCVPVRLVPLTDRPWLRNDFRQANLRDWVLANRSRLVHACLTLVRAWVAQSRSAYDGRPLGSFETWTQVMGGILQTVGVEGFLSNIETVYTGADAETREWATLVEVWGQEFGRQPVRASDLLPLCLEHDLLEGIIGSGNVRSQKSRLGRALARSVDRVFNGVRIRRDSSVTLNSARYFLDTISDLTELAA